MKKLILFLVVMSLFVMAPAMAVDCPDGQELNSEGICVDKPHYAINFLNLLPRINQENFWLTQAGSSVILNWSTNQFMNGTVFAVNKATDQVLEFYGEDSATYHTVNLVLPKGEWTLTPISDYVFQTFRGKTAEVIIN